MRYRVALQGFTSFERHALLFCFHEAEEREPGYEFVETRVDADLIVADGDSEDVADSIRRHGLMGITAFVSLLPGKDENKLYWQRLPGHYWWFPVLRAKPAAQVLLGHTSPKLKRSDGPMPLVASQFIGAGRVLFSAIDESYRWRSLHEDAYNQYWIKGIRYLFEGRLVAGNTRFRIRMSSDKVELGEPVKITVEAQDELFRPLTASQVEISLKKDAGLGEVLKLPSVAEAPGRYELLWQPPSAGFYRFGPVVKYTRHCSSNVAIPPMPEPMITPVRSGTYPVPSPNPASCIA